MICNCSDDVSLNFSKPIIKSDILELVDNLLHNFPAGVFSK
eukprot:05688.XXX_235179_235301_1 [CDS] Oithona nana genome sequencing.